MERNTEQISFERSLERLRQIVEKLGSGELSLEESLALFEEGSALSAGCYDALKRAEQKIVDISGKVQTFEE